MHKKDTNDCCSGNINLRAFVHSVAPHQPKHIWSLIWIYTGHVAVTRSFYEISDKQQILESYSTDIYQYIMTNTQRLEDSRAVLKGENKKDE